MKTTTEFWKNWYNDWARRQGSDFEVNRGTAVRLEQLERQSEQQFLQALDPQPTDVVLDAGCGTGRNLSVLSPRVKEIVGIDLAEGMLERAEKRVAEESLPNVRLRLGSVTALPFAKDSFHKIVCASVLQYLNATECETAFREMVRVCRNQGTIVIHAKNSSSLYGISLLLLKLAAKLIGRKTTPDHYRRRAWYERALRRAGAKVVDYDAFGILTFVPLPPAVVRQLLQWEMAWMTRKWMKKFGVNYKMTVRVFK